VRFLVDMGLSVSIGRYLIEHGHDGVHLRDLQLQTITDQAIVSMARAEGRVILTHDLDFSRIVALSGSRVPSVVTFRLADMRPLSVVRVLDHVLRTRSAEIDEGAMITATDGSLRVRRLPVGGPDSR